MFVLTVAYQMIGATMPTVPFSKLLVRGRERKRVKTLLMHLDQVLARDAKVSVVDDPASFKGQQVLDDLLGNGLPEAAGLIRQRLVDLIAARV